jgi:hypothetical protein
MLIYITNLYLCGTHTHVLHIAFKILSPNLDEAMITLAFAKQILELMSLEHN